VTIRSLPIELWPQADRDAWVAACEPARRLKRGGSASHLKPITQRDLARRYGYFLDFLNRRNLLRTDATATAEVAPGNVADYIDELKARVSSVTLYGSIYKLRRASELMAPGRDFAWLAEIEKDLALVMRPRSKFERTVLAEVLVEAGLTWIHKAETSPNLTRLARARQVRNGLMIALLGFCPIRLKNFAALEIGRSFVEIKGKWWIVLAAHGTKEGRADERPVDDLLKSAIDRYLDEYRQVLASTENPPSALWLSSNDGMRMSYAGVEQVIKATTAATVGVDVSPHLFRTSAASTSATCGGDNLHLGSALLNHRHRAVTDEHYNRASSLSAAERLRQVVRRYQEGAG
jgi:site-specific recombinase XerD